jgi:hypothetical protein
MQDESGNIIALVMLILAVISLVGAGALLMSRYDVRYTGALRSYDTVFNLADGATTLSYKYLGRHKSDQALTGESAVTSKSNIKPPTPQTIFCQCKNSSECSSTPPVTCPSGRCIDKSAGDFQSQIQFVPPINDNVKYMQGYEPNSVYIQYWNGVGAANRGHGQLVTTTDVNLSNATVAASVQQVVPKGGGQ